MNWKEPSPGLLLSLASLVVHLDELFGSGGSDFDKMAAQGILRNPELKEWLDSIPDVLLPEKRS